MKTTRVLCGLTAALMVLVNVPVFGQKVRFPTPVQSESTSAAPLTPTPGPTTVGPGPTATFDGTIQPPPAKWDPYAAPNVPQPLLSQDPAFQYGGPNFPSSLAHMQKVIQAVRLDYLWIPGRGMEEFGVQDMEMNATVAIPLFRNTFTPLLITPGFAMHLWAGPPSPFDLPPRAYDAYLDAAWNPQITPWFGGEVSFRTGIYSDFQRITAQSMRYMGKGMAVLTFSPTIKIKAGVWYLDRNKIKLLPAGGIIWTPNDMTRLDILFPNPKLARRLANYGNTEWWLYVRGEYGGGKWSVKRPPSPPFVTTFMDSVDYNDFRAALGLEWDNTRLFDGLFEVGISFEREVFSRMQGITFRPNPMIFARGGLTY